ncbi:hypothetical protein [Pseudomonas aeruginosa]|uniref:hypothetical protein n=1 Tax=Pseudomonas aeruginosa TaxID=287 RepID=UPI003D2CAFFB
MTKANECTCPSGDGSLRHPCPAHPASVELAGVGAKLTFINGRPAMCGCQVEYSSGGGEYSDVIDVTLCAKHSGSAILDLVATNRIALTPEYEGQWHADFYLDREIPLAKAEGATPAEAVLALMSAERIDPEQGGVDQAGGDRWDALQSIMEWTAAENIPDDRKLCLIRNAARAALAQPSPTLPPFAEKVLAKLRRFYDCAEDFESGGVDIGRHWLDLLTQLGLLNRVQRSPALWEISQQGEDLLGTPHPSPAQAEKAEAERQEVVDFNPYRYHAEKIRQRADGAASAYEAGRSALGYMEDIAESALIVRNGLDELSAQHERITAKLHDALDESDGDRWKMRSERDAANARLHEVATACATAEQERDGLWRDLRDARAHIDTQAAVTAQLKGERDAALARVAELEHVLRVVVNAADHGSWPTTVMNGIEKVREVLAGSAPPVKAQPEETPGEILAAKLIETWVEKHGKPAPWSKIVEITALATNMPNDERDRLLALDDDVDAQAQHSVPEKVRTLLSRAQCEIEHLAECLENVCEDEEDFDVREDVADGRVVAADIAHMLAAAPGKEVPQAWLDVQTERRRQITVEGFDTSNDDGSAGQIALAAGCYALHAGGIGTDWPGGIRNGSALFWPWDEEWWKPKSARENLVRAGALVLAEIERLDRAGAPGKEGV